jgi:NADH:ubiquinone oxidoreductase subunit H
MTLYELLISLNILDVFQDLFFYIQYQYPSFWNLIETVFITVYSYFSFSFLFLYNSFFIIFAMKYLNSAIFNMGIKFILLIALLVFVRGGIPRYRFDFLTKIGWIKYLSLVVIVFLSSLLLTLVI